MNDNKRSKRSKAAPVNGNRRGLEKYKVIGKCRCGSCMALFDALGEGSDQMRIEGSESRSQDLGGDNGAVIKAQRS